MRVLHVIAGAKEGGAETMMLDGAVALAEAGVESHAVIRAAHEGRIATLEQAGVGVTRASFDPLFRFTTDLALARAIRRFAPDLIHYWMGRAGSFAPARWRERNLGWYGGYYKLARFKHCAWHAAVTSDIVRNIIAQGAPSDQVSVLPTYANIERAAPVDRASLDTPADAMVVLSLARLHWKKGIDTLLDAMRELPGIYCWIAGDGPLEAELKAQATRLGLDDRVRFLGWRNDRAALLAACDVVAFPSRYEPFGNVTPEAWAAGKPLVVADAQGPAATVTNEEDALLVAKDDVKALAAALKRVIEDKALAAKLVANGARVYQEKYTRAAFVREALALYDRMLSALPSGAENPR
ncbi:MAG: glycosyltransferase [Hyphomonadaceae bacterium]